MGDSRERRRGFVIPVGAQVVLREDLQLAGGVVRKQGLVAVVVQSPPHTAEPYTVQFADGRTATVLERQIALRRRELEDLLAERQVDLRPWIIYRCRVGSKAYGLAREGSDDDLRGIFLPPARMQWSLYPLPEQIESAPGEGDEAYWELGKFIRLALKANPNVLETLWTPQVLAADETAEELRTHRGAFLSKQLFKSYSGYVLSQFRRMAASQARSRSFKPKHAMHLVRLLHSGISALRTGEIQVEVTEHREELLAIRRGELNFEEVRARALELDREFQQAFEATTLPDQPDYELADKLLIAARRRMVDA